MNSVKRTQNISSVVAEFNTKYLEYGKYDCNLLFMKLYEPDLYSSMYGNYDSVLSGTKLAKEVTGYSSLREFCEEESQYDPVNANFAKTGDIILFKSAHDLFIHLGNTVFGVNQDGYFSVRPIIFENEDVIAYRKGA